MNHNKEQVLEALRQVKHPETGKDLVSMEIVQDIAFNENKIIISLNLPANDPFKNSIRKAAAEATHKFVDAKADVEVIINQATKPVEEKKGTALLPQVKNIIAVASGKGGVGKSTVAANLAVALAMTGAKVGLMDADIFGPSIPKMFDEETAQPPVTEIEGRNMMVPVEKYGVKLLSIGFFVKPSDAVVWRGPMASNALKQLLGDTHWGALDYLLIDLPPGTSDIHITLVQTVPVTGAIIVTTPQDMALADAIKGINMFRGQQVNVPVLGLVENMSWFTPEELPGNKYYIFGKDGGKRLSEKENIPLLGQIPIVQSIREDGDAGKPSALRAGSLTGNAFSALAQKVIAEVAKRNAALPPTKKIEFNT